jgi:hypothetical protein
LRQLKAAETVMPREVRIISDSAGSSASSLGGERHEVNVHHRYYGSSALNGGERIVETRRGQRPRAVNIRGF